MNNFFKDQVIGYLITNQAPNKITYSSHKETKVFGFWIYLGNKQDTYIIKKRLGFLKYECTKVDATEAEANIQHTKYIELQNGYSFSNEAFISLYYNSLTINDLPPLKAFLYGISGYYKIIGFWENKKYRKSFSKNEKAYSLFSDRLRLLELIIDIRQKQYDENDTFAETITRDKLIKSIARASIVTSSGYYVFIEPILKGLQQEGAISYVQNKEIIINPKAWQIVSEYYVEERRHSDSQKSLKWQRYLTAILAIASLLNIFKDKLKITEWLDWLAKP